MKEKNNIYNLEDYRATSKLLKNAQNQRRLSELSTLKRLVAETLVVLAGSGTAFFGSYIALISNDNLSIGNILLLDGAMAAGAIGGMFSAIALWEEALEIYDIYDYFNEQGIDINEKAKQKVLLKSNKKEKK